MKVGNLDLQPQSLSQTIHIGDESGYEFTVKAKHDVEDDRGWNASVTIKSYGLVDAKSAVLHLRDAAEHFIRMLRESEEGHEQSKR